MPNSAHIVAIGGGGGATQVLRAAQPFAGQLTAIIAVTDTGRSTGLARAIGNIPAPGDLRATLAAFATNPQIATLLQYRFDGSGVPELAGMAFGNLLLAALAQMNGDFALAVEQAAELAGCSITVLPVSTSNTQLCAELADGSIVQGELAVRGLHKPPITRLFLSTPALAHPPVLAAIQQADLVVLGPGSLFTTLLAALLTDGLVEALYTSRARVAYVCNTTTQPGQTDGYRVFDHVQRLVEALGPGVLDWVLINRSQPDPQVLHNLQQQGLSLLDPDDDELLAITALGPQPLVRPLAEHGDAGRVLWNKQDTLRHAPEALRAALGELLG